MPIAEGEAPRPETLRALDTVAEPADPDDAERARLAAVARYDILDTPPDGAFDRIAALAARLMDAPMATVSIVDTDRVWFKATYGIEGLTEVRRSLSLCSSAIQQDGTYIVSDTLNDPRAACNPLLTEQMGVRCYVGAPIVTSDGYRLGTVNVLDTRPRQVDERDAAMLADLAAVVVDQLELRLSSLRVERERALREQAEQDTATVEQFAGTLRRSLLPPALPRVPGLGLSCHYHAASQRKVTGDFYDVFTLGDGRWAFFMGDMTGHGTAAAAVTSLARYTLRAAALHHAEPADGLAELNVALRLDQQVSQLCTVLFGVAEPQPDGSCLLTLASGGHPPPVLLRPAGGAVRAQEVGPVGGTLVGALDDASFTTQRLRLAPGETLLLYTDGLIESCVDGLPVDESGLVKFLSECDDCAAAAVVTRLTELIATFTPPPEDDVALLALTAAPAD